MYIPHLLYPLTRCLGCSHILTLINNAARNIVVYLFTLVILFSFNKYPEVKLLDHMVVLFLIFFTSSQHLLFVVFLIIAILERCQVISHCVFFFLNNLINLCLALLGLHCCTGFSLVVVLGLFIASLVVRASIISASSLENTDSVVVAHGLGALQHVKSSQIRD